MFVNLVPMVRRIGEDSFGVAGNASVNGRSIFRLGPMERYITAVNVVVTKDVCGARLLPAG